MYLHLSRVFHAQLFQNRKSFRLNKRDMVCVNFFLFWTRLSISFDCAVFNLEFFVFILCTRTDLCFCGSGLKRGRVLVCVGLL